MGPALFYWGGNGINRSARSYKTYVLQFVEYVRGPVYTNTIESFFSILKRGLNGVYQHVGAQHLRRYIGEFDFRYNTREKTDMGRMNDAADRHAENA